MRLNHFRRVLITAAATTTVISCCAVVVHMSQRLVVFVGSSSSRRSYSLSSRSSSCFVSAFSHHHRLTHRHHQQLYQRSFHFFSPSPAALAAMTTPFNKMKTTSTTTTTAAATSSATTASTDNSNSNYYWNRETSLKRQYSVHAPIVQSANILAIADPNDPANAMLYYNYYNQKHQNNSNHNNNNNTPEKEQDEMGLPDGATLVKIVSSMQDLLDHDENDDNNNKNTSSTVLAQLQAAQVNTIFVSHSAAREPLAYLLQHLPNNSIRWIHFRSAGLDAYTSPALAEWYRNHNNNNKQQQNAAADTTTTTTTTGVVVTNAKGQFSSTLAEYSLMACSYFAKDLPRLLRNKQNKQWNKYSVLELRGATMGIVGFGDIGQAAAKLASVYGMKILALRRGRRRQQQQQQQNAADALCHAVYYNDDDDENDSDNNHDHDNNNKMTALNRIFAESDYILCAAPLTPETRGMIGAEQFRCAKQDAVFINVGRGAIVDEEALVDALQSGKLKGAALDVFCVEPLPESSPLSEMDNVLLSPHNMDQTATFMHEATEFFVQENVPRFLRGEPLLNQVDPVAGY